MSNEILKIKLHTQRTKNGLLVFHLIHIMLKVKSYWPLRFVNKSIYCRPGAFQYTLDNLGRRPLYSQGFSWQISNRQSSVLG